MMKLIDRGILGAASLCALSCTATVVYEEDFQKLGDYCPGVVHDLKSVTLFNDPCWLQNYMLCVHAQRDLLVWEKGIPVAKGDFDVSFEVKNSAPVGYGVVIGSEKVVVTNVEKRTWSAVQVKSRGGVADVYAMKNRVYEKVASVKVPKDLASINVFAPDKSSFCLRDVRSETAREGFAQDSSVTRFYPDFAALTQPFDGTVCDSPTAVTLAPAPRCGIRLQKNKGQIAVVWDRPDTRGVLCAYSNAVSYVSKTTYPDGALDFPGICTRYVLPHLWAFGSRNPEFDLHPEFVDLNREWQTVPNATNAVTDIDFVKTDAGVEIWVEGCYVETRKTEKPCTFILSGGAKYALKTAPAAEDAAYLPLDLAANPKGKAFAKAELKGVKPGMQFLDKGFLGFGGTIPMNVVKPLDSQDIGLSREVQGVWALEEDEYFNQNRSPIMGYPCESHFIVPAATYRKVALAFALDPDPKKDAILTLTFGNYRAGAGGNMMKQTTLDFTKGVPDTCRKVGEVALGGKTVPLYYTVVDIDLGRIIDLTTGDHLDLDLVGKLWENFQQNDKSIRPDARSVSSFNVFAITLVKSPVRAKVVQYGPGSCFPKDAAKKASAIEVSSGFGKASGAVECAIVDEDGRTVKKISEPYAVAGTETKTVTADLSGLDTGWYELVWTVRDGSDAVLTHNARAAIVPPIGRKWSTTGSPYATWLFMACHGTPTDGDLAGRLLQMAGIRKATLGKKFADKYDITTIGSCYAPHMNEFGKPDFEKKVLEAAEKAKKTMPYVDHMMVWHENAPHGPDTLYELLGLPVAPPDAKRKEYNEKVAKYVTEIGRIMHKHYPDIELRIGNTGSSMGAVTYPMRGGADPAVYDSIGIETPSQMIPPERFLDVGLLGFLCPQQLASKWAKRRVRTDGSYEFIYRAERDIGLELQGEYQARDIVICLANGYTLISPGIFFDCSAGYYNGLWGGSGITERKPYCYPKKAYVAYAVATKVLDDVKFVRALDTGSSTVYALEFKRADGKTVTATWCVRGEYDFDFEGDAELVSLYGKKGSKHGSGRMTYIVSPKPIAKFRVSNRTFPLEDGIFKSAPVVCDVSERAFAVVPDPGVTSEDHTFFPQMKPGDIAATKVTDPERGAAVELTLKSDPAKTTSFWTEFTTLRFEKPVEIPGEPVILGVEVMGNSNWGQFRFEIEDADGEVFKNLTTGSFWGCDIIDWPGRLAVAFDGWSWVAASLRKNAYFPDHSPGPYEEQWQSMGGDKKIRYPIKLRAITVGMNRDKTNLFGFEPSAPSIRIKSVRAR